MAAHQLARIHSAMIEAVAENGYENLKVRDVVRRAGVSTRAFYELFDGKEDCFIHTYDLIVRRTTRRMIAAQTSEHDWRARCRLIFDEFARQLEQDPEAAELTLVEAYKGGQACLERARQAERTFEGMLSDCLARSPNGVVVPPLIVEGVVAGIVGMSRRHLLSRKEGDPLDSRIELIDWALSYVDSAALELGELDRRSVWRDTTLEPSPNGDFARQATGDRALILNATADLAAQNGYAFLTVERMRAASHVSRGRFQAHFNDVEHCYIAALQQRMSEALARAARAQIAARTWSGGVYRTIAAHCECLAGDPFLARAFLEGDLPPGNAGSRSRERLVKAVADQLREGIPRSSRPTQLAQEASAHAVWSLLHHYLLRERLSRSGISATLTYFLLVPAIGPQAALAAIRSEQ